MLQATPIADIRAAVTAVTQTTENRMFTSLIPTPCTRHCTPADRTRCPLSLTIAVAIY
jgi:hypothetical protein